jgi:hypothetical protein
MTRSELRRLTRTAHPTPTAAVAGIPPPAGERDSLPISLAGPGVPVAAAADALPEAGTPGA